MRDVMQQIRNFSIIAHIDHGKSTLADRMLEMTDTVEKRKMKEQVLDAMELERERGITIKMTPVRMEHEVDGERYILNLIDTPGHIDFAYEVSRALKAVEGVLLLVDATQGVQAQTLSVLDLSREHDLVIIPVLSKVDAPLARVDEVKLELATLLDCDVDDVFETSGKTGQGVRELLDALVENIPSPAHRTEHEDFRSLVFDFEYSNHRGVIVYIRVFDGEVAKGDRLKFAAANESFQVIECGIFSPDQKPVSKLQAGEIGYLVTGIKEPGVATVGDTLLSQKSILPPLAGYERPAPIVWASVYPESQDDFMPLKQALDRLRLSDSSLSYEEETSGVLGRGFRCGFLGMLHLEIVTERLRREFELELIVTSPSIVYEVVMQDGQRQRVYSPHKFPDHGATRAIYEPWTHLTIIVPSEHVSAVLQLLHEHEGVVMDTQTMGDGRAKMRIDMPLRELMRNFFDKIKSSTAGYASIAYELGELREADVVRLDVLVAEETVPAFTRVVSRRRAYEEAERVVEKLHETLPRQQFATKIQAAALGRILSSKTLSAFRKDVTAKLYGGDVTRKMKLLEKQKKGKKKAQQSGKVNIPHDVFLKMMRSE